MGKNTSRALKGGTAALSIGLGGGALAVALMNAGRHPATVIVHPAAQSRPAATRTAAPSPSRSAAPATTSPVPAHTTDPAPAPARTTDPAPAPAAPAPVPAQPQQPQLTNGVAVVLQYYQDISDQNYQSAWAIGGSNLAAQNGQTYASWAEGYSTTTASIRVTSYGTWNDGTVWTYISATQLDGTVKTYYGTYTVTDGVITSANIQQI
jgi:hypothetical protein